jgi:orotidine-5'-phosphate decarboxylase
VGQLLVALDVDSAARALALATELRNLAGGFKVGSRLFTLEGPDLVRRLVSLGAPVFLDLKFHDIPNTVRSAARSAAACGASLITVHATGGRAMITAAVEGAGGDCRVLAVTILTSFDGPGLSEALGKPVSSMADEVMRLAGLSLNAGAYGVVCSGQESARVVEEFKGRLATLVPGVRLAGDAANDQSRVVTPADAARAGASFMILGRTVTAAPDPIVAMRRVLDELTS